MGHCSWANINETEKNYRDNEWGIPVHDDRHMFEHLTLECLQCGQRMEISDTSIPSLWMIRKQFCRSTAGEIRKQLMFITTLR